MANTMVNAVIDTAIEVSKGLNPKEAIEFWYKLGKEFTDTGNALSIAQIDPRKEDDQNG